MKYLKLFEELDYTEKSYDDLDKVYKGYTYLYSEQEIKFEDISKEETIITILYNRADASDTDSEYIYRIKTKHPLYKEEKMSSYFDRMFNDPSKFNEEREYSGKIYEDIISNLKASIKVEDIIEFKLIGGFKKFDKDSPNKLDSKLSDQTDSFLHSYISGTILHDKITPEIEKELSIFKPNKSIKIYKGIEEVQIKHHTDKKPPYKVGDIIEWDYPFYSSWSSNFLIAKRFIDEYPSSPPFVIEMIANPEDILADTRMIPYQYYQTNQREIIMKRNIEYKFKIVWSR